MKYILTCVILMLLISSCEDVIDFELEGHEPILVIDAFLSTEGTQQFIKISESIPYLNDGGYNKVSGASVIVSDALTDYIFTEQEPGIYASPNPLTLSSETEYTLRVTYNATTYTATSKAKDIGSPLDTIAVWQEFDTIPILNEVDSSYSLYIARQETPGIGDFYLGKYYINGVLETDTVREMGWTDDIFFDGQYVVFPVYQIDHKKLTSGDTVKLDMFTITRQYNDYLLFILFQTDFKGGLFDTPSANVKGNFDNGAVGYFIVCDVTSSKTIVP
jgi:hypothetical protein